MKYFLMVVTALMLTACVSKPDDTEAFKYIEDYVQASGYYTAANLKRVNGWEEGPDYLVEYNYDIVLMDDLDKVVVRSSERYKEQYESFDFNELYVLEGALSSGSKDARAFGGIAAFGLTMTPEGKEFLKWGKKMKNNEVGASIVEFVKSADAKDAYMRRAVAFNHLTNIVMEHDVKPDAKKGQLVKNVNWTARYIKTEQGWKLKL